MKVRRLVLTVVLVWVLPISSRSSGVERQDSLTLQSQSIAQAYLKQLGSGYTAASDSERHLLYISALDKNHFAQTAQLLSNYADWLGETLGLASPPYTVTIILPTSTDFSRLVNDSRLTGIYRPAIKTLVSIDRGQVLLHEFTHALHDGDMSERRQKHAFWLIEGLACLLSENISCDSRFVPGPEVNLRYLQQMLREKKAIPLDKLLAADSQAFMSSPQLYYSQSRYLVHYLYQQGKLAEFYAAYKANCGDDATGGKALEKVTGVTRSQLEQDFSIWVLGLRAPHHQRQQARLGLIVEDQPQGPQVVGFSEGSAAETAGQFKRGDIVRSVNGRNVANSAEFTAAVRSAGAMQTATIEVDRGGQKLTLRQPLGSSVQ